MNQREYTPWGNVKGEPMSGREAQRRDDHLETEEWREAWGVMHPDAYKDMHYPRPGLCHTSPSRMRGFLLVGPVYGGTVRRGR
jgi:hypothetical protein